MAEDNRLVELVADLLLEVREMKTDIRELKTDVGDIRSDLKGFREETNGNFNRLEKRVERLEDQQIKTNLSLGELRLSVMKMSEELKAMVDLDKRLRVVESIVLKAS